MRQNFPHFYRRTLALTLLLFSVLLFNAGTVNVRANLSTALWGADSPNPSLTVLDSDYRAPTGATDYCNEQDVTLANVWHPLGYYSGFFGKKTYQKCMIPAPFGAMSSDASILQTGEGIYHVANSFGQAVQVPNTNKLFIKGGQLSIYPIEDFVAGPGYEHMPGDRYKTEYRLKDGVGAIMLKGSSGEVVGDLSVIKASPDGKWLLAERNDEALRISTDNISEILTFPAPIVSANPGYAADDSMAITNDGRYAAIGGGRGPNLILYDLSTCDPDLTNNLKNASGCHYDKFKMPDYLSKELGEIVIHIDQLQFSQEGTELFMRILVQDKLGQKHNRLVMLQAPGTQQNNDYIALGDSYSSGEGTSSYLLGTDDDNNKCHLSLFSYPYLINHDQPFNTMHSVACSGAKMINVIGAGSSAAQYATLPTYNSLGDWLPGFRDQLHYIALNQPKVVTIGMVGNDVGFKDILVNCMLPGTCYSTYEERYGLMLDINSKFDQLVNMYTDLKRASPASRIYVVDYPQIAKNDGNCAVNVHLNASEIRFSNNLIDYLNTMIRHAAAKAGVGFVDIQNSLDGYQLCDSSTTSYAMNGLTAGDDTLFHTISNGSYHPTALGHTLFARTIESQTNNLSNPMPHPDAAAVTPDKIDAAYLLDAPKSGETIRRIILGDEAKNPVLRGSTGQLIIQPVDNLLKPLTQYQIILHSNPVLLGTPRTDENGDLNYTYTIPADTDPGFHILHVYGNDTDGQPIDIQQRVYVAVSNDDWDGDGVPNTQEPCGLIDQSGLDVDQDGIDDACDGVIGPAPSNPSPSGSSTGTAGAGTSAPQSSVAAGKTVGSASTLGTALQTAAAINQMIPQTNVLGDATNAAKPHVNQSRPVAHPNKLTAKVSSEWPLWAGLVMALAAVLYLVKRRLAKAN